MTHATLIDICATLAGFGIAIRVLAPRELHVAGLVLLALGWGGLLVDVAPSSISDHPLRVVVACVVGAGACAALARWVARPWPAVLVGVATLALPLRVPIVLGGSTRNLLVPLYAVLGAWLLLDLGRSAIVMRDAPSLRAVVQRSRARLGTQLRGAASAAQLIDIAIAGYALWSCLSLAWDFDRTTGEVNLALFTVPFALLFALARDVLRGPDASRLLRVAAYALFTVLGVAALAGILQHITGSIWENPKVRIADVFQPDFRTNSLFWDPNIYGRYLVAGLLGALSLSVWGAVRGVRRWLLIGWIVVGLIGLWWTYSQSSWIALAVGCIVLALLALPRRAASITVIAAVIAVVGLGFVADHQGVFRNQDRIDVAEGGVSLMSNAPMRGYGIGSFDHAYASYEGSRGNTHLRLRASHATPVTVGAELGLIGLAAYLALLIGTILATAAGRAIDGPLGVQALTRGAASDTTEIDADGASMLTIAQPVLVVRPDLARWAGATFIAVIAHSLLYAGFFEDPLVWATAAALAAAPLGVPALRPGVDRAEPDALIDATRAATH